MDSVKVLVILEECVDTTHCVALNDTRPNVRVYLVTRAIH